MRTRWKISRLRRRPRRRRSSARGCTERRPRRFPPRTANSTPPPRRRSGVHAVHPGERPVPSTARPEDDPSPGFPPRRTTRTTRTSTTTRIPSARLVIFQLRGFRISPPRERRSPRGDTAIAGSARWVRWRRRRREASPSDARRKTRWRRIQAVGRGTSRASSTARGWTRRDERNRRRGERRRRRSERKRRCGSRRRMPTWSGNPRSGT